MSTFVINPASEVVGVGGDIADIEDRILSNFIPAESE